MSRLILSLALIIMTAGVVHAQSFRGPAQRSAPPVRKSPIGSSSVQKANGTGGFANAVSNTDFQAPVSTTSAPTHQFGTGFTAPNTFTYAQPGAGDIAAGTFAGADTFSSAPTFSSITGQTQCLQANTAGLVSGTGALCGSGGGGGGLPTQLTTTDANGNVAWVQGLTGVNFKYYTAIAGSFTMTNYGGL